MREETTQFKQPGDPILDLARWAGIALLVYSVMLALEGLSGVGRRDAGLWQLGAAVIPYAALGIVLVFSQERIERSGSLAPRIVAILLLSAAVFIGLKLFTTNATSLWLVYPDGFWGQLRALTTLGLPIIFLFLLLISHEERDQRLVALAGLAVSVMVLVTSAAVALWDINQPGMNVLRAISSLIPGGSFAFVLGIASLHRLGFAHTRRTAIWVVVLLAISSLASVGNTIDLAPFAETWWVVGLMQATRWPLMLLVLAFAGLLVRRFAFIAAGVCALELVVSLVGYVVAVGNDIQASGLFWLVSLNLARTGAMLLLVLVTVEVFERNRTWRAPRSAAARPGRTRRRSRRAGLP